MSTYVNPSLNPVLPNRLSLIQFIQTVMVGVSGLPGTLVRPRWQQKPPPQPGIDTDWLAFGIIFSDPDANGYLGDGPIVGDEQTTISQRHEGLEVLCSIYGPNALENADIIRDGFQIPWNLDGLRQGNMGFVCTGKIIHLPELINERWVERYEMTVSLRREIQRTYPILTFISASGTMSADSVGGDIKDITIKVEPPSP